MAIDLYTPPKLWAPSRPAIVRAANLDSIPHWSDIVRDARRTKREREERAFQPPVIPPVGGSVASITYTDKAKHVTLASLSSYTFTDMAAGAADSTRNLHCCLSTSAAASPTGVTIGGQTAAQKVLANQANERCEVWSASVPSGTTATVVVTYGGAASRYVQAMLFQTLNCSLTATDTSTDIDSNPATATTFDVAAGGVALAALCHRVNSPGATYTWANLTEAVDEALVADDTYVSAAAAYFAAAQTSLAVSATASAAGVRSPVMAVVSFPSV